MSEPPLPPAAVELPHRSAPAVTAPQYTRGTGSGPRRDSDRAVV
ncbi:hypothetical protein [Nocardia wallacei]|nr:hypothetical protein [Nocardia wallacei]